MKIVVLDGYTENPGDLSWDSFKAYGEVEVYDRTSYVDSPLIAERIGEPLEVVWNITRTANVIAANVRRKDIPLIETVEGVVSVAVETEHQLQGDHGTGADKPSITK